MTPVLIPSPGGDCFAMYGAAPGPVVLFCPPIGDECRKTARLWRDLAVRLQDLGLASLRFDFPGTCNSAGEPTDPDLVDNWRAAIRACAAWVAPRHGGRVILFGYRFGALMALDAASTISTERLVLLDPPDSGAATARYLRSRARLEATGPLPEGEDFIQAGGMPLSQAALAAISAMPARIEHARVPSALLVLHQTPKPSPWPTRLASAGCSVETIPFEGYQDFAPLDSFKAKPPMAMIDRVVAYLAPIAGSTTPVSIADLPKSPKLEFGEFTETPIRFGPGRALFGILCRPDTARSDLPAVLLPTTGVDPCYGMSRMWTDLARRLARQGVVSLRFDMAGVGESQGSLGPNILAAMYQMDRFADLRSALDALETRGSDRFVVVGYCSGAYAAWHTAMSDERIAGVLAGNLLYMTKQPTFLEEVLQLKPGGSVVGLRQSRLRKILPGAAILALRRLDDRARRALPRSLRNFLRGWGADPKETRRHVHALSDRRCAVRLVMAQDDHGHIRLRRAFGETPRLPNGIELKVIEGADHLFSDRRHRAEFLDLAAAFVLETKTRRFTPTAQSHPVRLLETTS